jgi:hypothetical protein
MIFYFIFWWFKLCIKHWSLKIDTPYCIIWLVINVICDMCSIIPTTISLLHKLTPKRHNMILRCLQARVSIFGHHNVIFFTLTDYNVYHVKKITTLIKRDLIIWSLYNLWWYKIGIIWNQNFYVKWGTFSWKPFVLSQSFIEVGNGLTMIRVCNEIT